MVVGEDAGPAAVPELTQPDGKENVLKKYGKDYRRAADGYEYIGSWYKTSLTGDALKKEARFSGFALP